MSRIKHREAFFTAVIVGGLAALLFGPGPTMEAPGPLEAEAPIVRSVSG